MRDGPPRGLFPEQALITPALVYNYSPLEGQSRLKNEGLSVR